MIRRCLTVILASLLGVALGIQGQTAAPSTTVPVPTPAAPAAPSTPPAVAPDAPPPTVPPVAVPTPPSISTPPAVTPPAAPRVVPPPAAPSARRKLNTAPPLSPEAQPSQPAAVVRERERTIYVPYEQLEKVFTDDGKGVFLPYKEFLELWQELNLKRAKDETKPPQEGVVSRAEYTGVVEGDMLTIDAKITVESFKEGWLTIPLSRGGVLPGVTDVDAGKATLSSKPEGYDLIVPDKGVYELKMKLHAGIGRSGGKSRLNLTLPSAAVSRFTATVPGNGWEFEVNPSAAFTSRPAGDKTELSFFFGSGSKFDIAWSKPEAAVALKPLILASNKVTSEVRGGSLATTAAIDLRILRAPVSEFVISVPAGQSVLSVTGDDVKEWKLDGADAPAGGAPQKLTITLNEPAKDKWGGTVSLEAPLPKLPADAPVPLIQISSAAQDRGDLTVVAEPQLDVIPKAGEGLIQQTAAGDAAAGLVNVSAYRYLKHPAQLALTVSEAKPQVDVESLTTFTVERDRSRVETTFQYQVRRVGIFDARVQLPSGWTGWEVVGANADAWTVEKNGNVEVLAMKFPKQTLGSASFTLRGQQLRANPTDDATVPVFTPQNVARHDAKIGVSVHSSLEVNTKDRGSLSLEDVNALRAVIVQYPREFDPPQVPQQIPQQQRVIAPREVMLAFRHRDAVQTPATLSFKPRPPQVNVQVLTLTQVKEQSTLHQWELAFDVGYAAIDKFILAVPKSVVGDIRLVDPQVKEIRKDYQPPANAAQPPLPNAENYALWEVVLRNERMGTFTLSLSHEQPGSGAQSATVDLLQVHVPGAFQETGQVAVLKDDNLEIVKAAAESMEEIDPRELSGSLQRAGVFLAYKYKAQPLSLKLEIARNAYISVPQAVITHAVLTSAVATDRAQTTEAIYWVKNNAQQFLTVRLPKTARLVSDVFVNGQTQQPMKREGADDLLIRLPSDAASRRAAFPVRFVYEVPSEEAGKKIGWWGGIPIEPPTLLDVTKVLEAHHALYLPESHDYTAFKGAMTLSVRDRGWARFRGLVNALVPAFGPAFTQSQGDWNTVPAITADQKAAFDFQVPTQGRNVVLHRLGEPAVIDVSFRSRGFSYFLEGVVFFVVLALGVARWKAPLRTKFRYLLIFGLGGILLTGILTPANGQVVKGSVFAAGIMAVAWTVCGFLRGVKNWMQRPKHRPPPLGGGSGGPPSPGGGPKPERPDLTPAMIPATPAPETAASAVTSESPAQTPPSSPPDIEFPKLDTPGAPKGDGGYEVK